MANRQLTELQAALAIGGDDILYGVTDPSGTPAPRKFTKADFFANGLIHFVLDGGGAVLTTGVKGDLVDIPFDLELSAVTLLAQEVGSIVIDIWVSSFASAPPNVGDTITASAKPTLSSEEKKQDLTLTGWTKAIPAGSVIRISVDSVTTLTRVAMGLRFRRT